MSIARSTTQAATEIQTRARRRPDPSQRDLQIYLDYQIAGQRQIDLAHDHKLTQCRISQIIRRVDAWRKESRIENQQSKIENESSPDSRSPTPDPLAFDFLVQSHRLNLVCREAIRHFQHQQATVTHRKGTRSDK